MKGMIAWFVENPVAANLVMVVIIVSGVLTLGNVKQEVFPEFSADMITISVLHPGAAPEEVEDGICIRIEEQIQGIDGVKQITSTAVENSGTVMVEVFPDADLRQVLDDVKTRIDAITTFPGEAEEPVIQELLVRRQVMSVALSGPTDEASLKALGTRIRDEISNLPNITQVELANTRPYEISVELSEEKLQRHRISFDEVARAIRASSLDLPGGALKTDGGEILLRTKGQAYTGEEFERIILHAAPDGTLLRLGDVATVVDGFEDTDLSASFDGEPSVLIQVFRVGEQDALEVAASVKRYITSASSRLPEGMKLTIWDDFSRILKSRRDLLVRNGRTGLLLVFLVLALFLRFRLAFWVTLGIPISFLGAIWLMPMLDVSINMITLFAFILVLGIVVDDAIVVGENIYTHSRRQGNAKKAAILGTQEVAVPVIFAVLTTVLAFVPLMFVPGTMGKIWKAIPLIVIPTLLFSLVESKMILPAHLRHLKPRKPGERSIFPWARFWNAFQERFATGVEVWIEHRYQPFLRRALNWRYLTIAITIAALVLTLGYTLAGFIKFTFMPQIESDQVTASLGFPLGTPYEVTAEAVGQIEAAAIRLKADLDAELPEGAESSVRHVLASVGQQPRKNEARGPHAGGGSTYTGSNMGEVQIELAPSEIRSMPSSEIASRWRSYTGSIADAVELTFTSSLFSAGDAINIQLSSANTEELRSATEVLKQRLAEYPGVIDIMDSYRAGKQEIKLDIKPEAQAMGLTLMDLARQVRQGFYGEEAQRILRGRDELKVMVRYPHDERRSLGDLEKMRIRMPSGSELPFSAVAEASLGRGFASIKRVDRQRVINVTAGIDDKVANANEVMSSVLSTVMPQVMGDHPHLHFALEGQQKEQREAVRGLLGGFAMALIGIYTLMAIPFKSYLHPLVIMTAIPFGLMGAVWGHILMGLDLSILSMCGMVALAGVVVNDSLVLTDNINRLRRGGMATFESVTRAASNRFRPILLTSLTTFAGLTPMLLERSLQAKFLIPMAAALAFGVIFSTAVTLIFIPCSYMALEDVLGKMKRLVGRE